VTAASHPVRLQRLVGLAAIVLITALAYLPIFRGGFIWDDETWIADNRLLRTLGGLRAIWLEPGRSPQYYPLTQTTLWLEYHLWGPRPLGYHLVNVALHALNAGLVWLTLARLAVPGAWVAAAVFALHPVHVESVAWAAELKNVQAGVFSLLALLLYLRFALGPALGGALRPGLRRLRARGAQQDRRTTSAPCRSIPSSRRRTTISPISTRIAETSRARSSTTRRRSRWSPP